MIRRRSIVLALEAWPVALREVLAVNEPKPAPQAYTLTNGDMGQTEAPQVKSPQTREPWRRGRPLR